MHHGPEEADELSGDGDDGDLGPLAVGEMIEALVQPLRGFPRMRDHCRRLALLSSPEVDAGVRSMAIAPRRLHEAMSAVAVAGFGDRAESLSGAARVFARDEAQVARELRGPFEASPVQGELVYTATDAGLEMRSDVATTQLAWSAFTRAVENGDFVLLFQNKQMAAFLPKGTFVSQDELMAFKRLVSEKLDGRAELQVAASSPAT